MDILKDKKEATPVNSAIYFRSYKPTLNLKNAHFRNYYLVTTDPAAIADARKLVSLGLAVELTDKEFEKANSIGTD